MSTGMRAIVIALALPAVPLAAQTPSSRSGSQLPSLPGQDAFAAVAEIVRILDADPRTDWSRVNLEALRTHLRDMNEVVLRSTVTQQDVPGGVTMLVAGEGSAVGAIQRMVAAHAIELARIPGWRAASEPTPTGVRLTVTTESGAATDVQRLRGLGFAGLLTVGAHHQEHHMAIARGGGHDSPAGHSH